MAGSLALASNAADQNFTTLSFPGTCNSGFIMIALIMMALIPPSFLEVPRRLRSLEVSSMSSTKHSELEVKGCSSHAWIDVVTSLSVKKTCLFATR